MPEEQRCPDCLGLGAKVVTYPVEDEEGYKYMAQKQEPCDGCAGKGWV